MQKRQHFSIFCCQSMLPAWKVVFWSWQHLWCQKK